MFLVTNISVLYFSSSLFGCEKSIVQAMCSKKPMNKLPRARKQKGNTYLTSESRVKLSLLIGRLKIDVSISNAIERYLTAKCQTAKIKARIFNPVMGPRTLNMTSNSVKSALNY